MLRPAGIDALVPLMDLRFQTPAWAVVALLVLLPLLALAVGDRRVRRVRAVLGLDPPVRSPVVAPAAAIAVLAVLVGTAAAQPVLVDDDRASVRRDAEVLFLVDISRSMLASSAPSSPDRFERATAAARRLRAAVPECPAGIASLTDRVLPHLFPTHDAEAFGAVLGRALGPGRIPPLAGGGRATSLEPIAELGQRSYFSEDVARRVVVVLTDGESVELDVARVRATLSEGPELGVVIVRVARRGERVFRADGTVEPYRMDPGAEADVARFASALGFEHVGEREPGRAEALLLRAVGRSPAAVASERRSTRALAPYVVLAALAPLGLLVVRRNRA